MLDTLFGLDMSWEGVGRKMYDMERCGKIWNMTWSLFFYKPWSIDTQYTITALVVIVATGEDYQRAIDRRQEPHHRRSSDFLYAFSYWFSP